MTNTEHGNRLLFSVVRCEPIKKRDVMPTFLVIVLVSLLFIAGGIYLALGLPGPEVLWNG